MKVLKKICSLFIIIVIFSLALSNISFALTSAASEYLDKESIVKIANYHISTYLKEDSQTKGMAIKASNDFVELYDINGNLYAYIVPIMEDGRGEIGYFTIGADKEDGSTYMIFIGENAVDKLNAKRKIIDKSNAKIVFIPPMKYIIMIKDVKGNNRYFDIPAITDLQNGITLNDTENDITIAIENNIDKLKDYYKYLDEKRDNTTVNKILDYFSKSNVNDITLMANEEVKLKKEAKGAFVPVYENNNIYYGGDQNWYGFFYKRLTGCGPTAAANITYYLADKDPSSYGVLYEYSSIDKNTFVKHMDTNFSYIAPGPFGELSLEDFASGVKNFAKSKNLLLASRILASNPSWTYDEVSTFIKTGLSWDVPVACLNLDWPFADDEVYPWHWVTATKYYRDVTTDQRWIAISSWGERYSVNFKSYIDSIKYSGGGFCYLF